MVKVESFQSYKSCCAFIAFTCTKFAYLSAKVDTLEDGEIDPKRARVDNTVAFTVDSRIKINQLLT